MAPRRHSQSSSPIRGMTITTITTTGPPVSGGVAIYAAPQNPPPSSSSRVLWTSCFAFTALALLHFNLFPLASFYNHASQQRSSLLNWEPSTSSLSVRSLTLHLWLLFFHRPLLLAVVLSRLQPHGTHLIRTLFALCACFCIACLVTSTVIRCRRRNRA
jgi:hypothetical protein